jgi:hypothetical protein
MSAAGFEPARSCLQWILIPYHSGKLTDPQRCHYRAAVHFLDRSYPRCGYVSLCEQHLRLFPTMRISCADISMHGLLCMLGWRVSFWAAHVCFVLSCVVAGKISRRRRIQINNKILHLAHIWLLSASEALAQATLCVSPSFSRRARVQITDEQCKFELISPTAIPCRIRRISSNLRS